MGSPWSDESGDRGCESPEGAMSWIGFIARYVWHDPVRADRDRTKFESEGGLEAEVKLRGDVRNPL